jgi:CheY-like chemotaxis protein
MLAGKSVLVVDDEPGIRMLAVRALRGAGGTAYEAANGHEALRVLEKAAMDVVVIDLIMPEKEGIETIVEIKQRWPGVKVIAVSGGGRIGPDTFLDLAHGLGADITMSKPLNFQALTVQVQALLQPPVTPT